MKALVGHTGFVGSNLCRQMAFDAFYNSKNIEDIRGQTFDLLVCAGMPAVKWLANKEPAKDRQVLESLWSALATVKVRTFVLISTVDVYPQPDGLGEQFDCRTVSGTPYGVHRLMLEQRVIETFAAHVVRLPALFGPGLKKNVLFDLMHKNCLENIQPASTFQWYDLAELAADLAAVQQENLPVVNLVPEPLQTSRIIQTCFPQLAGAVGAAAGPAVHYALQTRHGSQLRAGQRQSAPFLYDAEESLRRISAFVHSQRSEHGLAKAGAA